MLCENPDLFLIRFYPTRVRRDKGQRIFRSACVPLREPPAVCLAGRPRVLTAHAAPPRAERCTNARQARRRPHRALDGATTPRQGAS